MNNNLTNLNNVLYSQIERLDKLDVKDKYFSNEIGKSRALTNTAQQIIYGSKLILEGLKMIDDKTKKNETISDIIGLKDNGKKRA